MSQPKPPARLQLSWSGGQRFEASGASNLSLTLDGDSKEGFSPMGALLASLCGCMGIDVVVILEKMRVELKSVRIAAEGDRMDDPPRYFRRIRMSFEIEGDVSEDRAKRAVDLSRDKYCSVLHSLRKDLEVETSVRVVRSDGA